MVSFGEVLMEIDVKWAWRSGRNNKGLFFICVFSDVPNTLDDYTVHRRSRLAWWTADGIC